MITARERYLMIACLELHPAEGHLSAEEMDEWLLLKDHNGETYEVALSADADRSLAEVKRCT